ncbi:hypothetical protein GE09DRAFT_302996 [Coniochaeta sp. 2T2.1]|nr:hypothetical protein GE09DRAFT_302996 [Coniochaeta sp. 2T2.1]
MTQIDEDDRVDIDSLCEDCHGLLELSGGVYQLPHDSVREFLLETPASEFSALADFWKIRGTAHQRLAEACLAYLTLDVFDIERTTLSRGYDMEQLHGDYPLLRYSSLYWGDHIRKVGIDVAGHLDGLIHRFLLSPSHREVAMECMQNGLGRKRLRHHIGGQRYGFTLPLHLLALFDLGFLISAYGGDQSAFLHKDGFGFLPIDYAVERSRKEAFDRILDRFLPGPEAERMAQNSAYPLAYAVAKFNWADSLRKLLDLGFDANGRSARQNPLSCAAAWGHCVRFESYSMQMPILRQGMTKVTLPY